ncbi:uncharacterized protein HGUI_03943 [Hanseniaspora guilliermondii]|uniref:RING-type domain-containing protein n=1 Tax=Hanseniaspora guilliermondii TaxID=56406 RepID=A0A1L0FQ96_9ASCO|nr:uncharacterized protein HGUI_03943 [Hanseniaspora guilliermondii]
MIEPTMQDHDISNFESLLKELNSISHNTNEFNNLDFKYILRQRILIINKFEGLDNSIKNKIIQQLMMLGDRSNTNHDLSLKDIHVSLCRSSSIEDSNSNKPEQSDIKYDIKSDYNIINDHKCTHFKSSLKLYNQEQGLWYSCKNCFLDTKGKNRDSIKKIITRLLTHIKCDKCDFINEINCNTGDLQDEVINEKKKCINCDEFFSEYQCHYCLIFENDEENYMYHCPYCKECKLGEGLGIDYNHCKECDCCMPLEMFHNEEVSHRCIRNNLRSDCTICGVRLDAYQTYERLLGDDMESTHTSMNDTNDENSQVKQSSKSFQNNGIRKRPIIDIDVGRVQFLVPCNHAIHENCLNEYLKNGQYKCPICQVTIVDMEINFKLLDEEIQQCPLPEPYNMWRCVYKCNDCTTRGMTSYHFLGIKCRCCFSFNTVLLQVLKHIDEKMPMKNSDDQGITDTKRSIVSKEMVNESFMSRKRSNSDMKDNDMDNFLNKFLSKDEDLSISHVLQGLKEYYNVKKNDKKINNEENELGFVDAVDVNSMMNRLKFNVLNRFLSKKPNSDTESDTNELTEEKAEIDEDNSRQKTLFNDIGDSFKQFISFLEDSNGHDID